MDKKGHIRLIAILLNLSMLAGIIVPALACAGTTYEQITAETFNPGVSASARQQLGMFMIDIEPIQGNSGALLEVIDSDNKRMSIISATYGSYRSDAGSLMLAPIDEKTYKVVITSKISGNDYRGWVALQVDARDCAAGDVKVKVTELYGQFVNGTVVVGKATGRKVNIPAPKDEVCEIIFRIGDTNYTVNGVEYNMDVVPYMKENRTYLPVRYTAYAAGVADANIIWNQSDQSVTMVKGDCVVKMVIGSHTININGVNFIMDVVPELVEPGRTMVPIRYVAQALGCDVVWDDATQSIIIKQ
ncbi:MAG: copper amine oxidase N-terminal domain-containing protein [Desulfotomaculaceae bacterium]|nr:copper amine oxidase N-terminal domain-containing protein [Desulfotomaculaceae bacterium]